jgi:hypothetical protein
MWDMWDWSWGVEMVLDMVKRFVLGSNRGCDLRPDFT